MKILFVDDDPSKAKQLAPVLAQCGVENLDIFFAYDAMQARDFVQNSFFDLLILDLMLPAGAFSEPDVKHAVSFLSDLVVGSEYIKPRLILGITRDKNAQIEAEPIFAEHLMNIVIADETSNLWMAQVINCVKYLNSSEAIAVQRREYQTDVAIVCALASPEMEAIFSAGWDWQPEEPIDRTTMVRRATFQSQGKNFTAVCASAPRMGLTATAILSTRLIELTRPRFLVMAGICAGIEDKTSLGDVIFADPSWDYQSGKHSTDENGASFFSMAPHQLAASETVRSRVEILRRDKQLWRAIQDGWPAKSYGNLKLHIGPLASGSAVIADQSLVDVIKMQQRQLLGIEMEAYAVLAAAQSADHPKPTAFVMKSVCDFANHKKDDDAQLYAAYTSAMATKHFLERYTSEMYDFRD